MPTWIKVYFLKKEEICAAQTNEKYIAHKKDVICLISEWMKNRLYIFF